MLRILKSQYYHRSLFQMKNGVHYQPSICVSIECQSWIKLQVYFDAVNNRFEKLKRIFWFFLWLLQENSWRIFRKIDYHYQICTHHWGLYQSHYWLEYDGKEILFNELIYADICWKIHASIIWILFVQETKRQCIWLV